MLLPHRADTSFKLPSVTTDNMNNTQTSYKINIISLDKEGKRCVRTYITPKPAIQRVRIKKRTNEVSWLFRNWQHLNSY